MHRICTTALLVLMLGAATVRGAEPPVTALTFTPDGNELICGSQAGLVVRPVSNVKNVTRIETALEQIHDVQFSPRGDRLAVVGGVPAEEGMLEILDWPSRQSRLQLSIGEDLLYGVAWVEAGAKVAVAGFDGTIRLVDVDGGTVVTTLTGHSRGVTAVTDLGMSDFSATEFQLVTGSIDQTLRVWQPATGETVRTLHNHTAPVHAVALRPASDGLPVVASISDDRTVRFWQPTIGRMMRFVRLESVPLCLAWSAGGEHIIVGCADGHVRTLDPNTAAILHDETVLNHRIISLAVNPRTHSVAAGGSNGKIRLLPNVEREPASGDAH